MSQRDILIINPDEKLSLQLSNLIRHNYKAWNISAVENISGKEEFIPPLVVLVEAKLASFKLLARFLTPETAIIFIGKDRLELRQLSTDWPKEFYVDSFVIAPSEPWEDALGLVLDRAILHAEIKLDLLKTKTSLALQESKVREFYQEVQEIRKLINLNFIQEVEKRISIESRYIWIQKERQKIESIVRKIYEARDVGSLLDVIPEIRDIVHAESASVYIIEESEILGKFLKPILWDNAFLMHSDFSRYVTTIDAHDFASSAARFKQPINVNDISNAHQIASKYNLLIRTKLKNLLAVPIMHNGQVIGVLEVYNKSLSGVICPEAFSRNDREILSSISEHMALAMMNLNLIQYDALTGLLRPDPFFEQALQKVNAMSKRSHEEGAIALVIGDVDWFKNYNDRNGQEAGNRLLRDLAKTLRTSVRDEDLICRYGGEEFLFFLPGVKNIDDAVQMTERIRKNIEDQYFEFQEFQPGNNLTMSFGVTIFPKKSGQSISPLSKTDLKILVAEADLALARAKGKERREFNGKFIKEKLTKNKVFAFQQQKDFQAGLNIFIDVPPTFKEMRKHDRFNISTLLMLKENDSLLVAKTANLSRGGARIITETRLPIAATVDTYIILEDKACQLKSDVIYSEKAGKDPEVYHSGLKFKEISPPEAARLEKYLNDFKKK